MKFKIYFSLILFLMSISRLDAIKNNNLCTDDSSMRLPQCAQWREQQYAAYLLSKQKLFNKYQADFDTQEKLGELFDIFLQYTDEGVGIFEAYQAAGFSILTLSYAPDGKPIYKGGSSLVLSHPELPDYIIKLNKAKERLQGLEVLKKMCGKKCPYILPQKAIVGPFLLVQKIDFLDKDSDDYQEFLSKNDYKVQQLTLFLNRTGYCDGHRGNIKVTPAGQFAILDTDLSYFMAPHHLCRATKKLFEDGKYVLGYKEPICYSREELNEVN